MMRGILQTTIMTEYWYKKDDPNRKYPIPSKRIQLDMPYLPNVQAELKSEMRLLDGYYNLKYTDGKWSIRYDKNVVLKAIEVLAPHFDVSQLSAMISSIPVKNYNSNKTVSAEVVKGEIELNWPWLSDVELRDTVRNTVKNIPNRAWDAKKKVWRIPIAEAGLLVAQLEGVYDPLKEAIETLPEVSEWMEGLAKRIAISDAPELDDKEVVKEMKERLDGMFADGLELFPFQYVGVRFAELAGGRCLIGDDMGLGKTVQAIGYAALHQEQWPVLVVCPAGVKYNWYNEIRRWLPNCKTTVVNGWKGDIEEADFVVINYDLMYKRKEQLQKIGFNLSIIDESHYLKNVRTKRTKATLEIAKETEGVICLSGTAITNRPEEYFTTLNLIRSAQFSSWMKFVKRYADAYHDGFGWNTGGSSNEKELHNITRDFTIRRLKKEVMDELPNKIRQPLFVKPTDKEYNHYKNNQRRWVDEYQSIKSRGGSLPAGFMLNMLTDLRHECGLMKVKPTVDWVLNYKSQNEKPILIFAHHKDVIANLEDGFNSLRVATIKGDTPTKKRQLIADGFQDNQYDILICSMAAKEGLTLTAADTVVFVERQWVSAWEEQAEDRINRIGQDAQTVHAVYLSVKGTIDERFHRLIEEKREVTKSVLDGGDIEARKGIASSILNEMIDAGEIPAQMLELLGKN
jgi:SWI/SNF-related matrix-associated actin-dependent regulator 1 of chromatin subfamily A